MNVEKMKAELERLNLRQQQAGQKARDLQTKITKADRAYQTRRKIILGAWCAGMLETNPSVRNGLRAYIQDKDKGLFPDIFTTDEIAAARARMDAGKVNGENEISRTTRDKAQNGKADI